MKKVSVTQLVDFHRCEKLGILKLTKKENVNKARQDAMNRGVLLHENMERQAVVDGRCFVASFAFGSEADETIKLRSFRDSFLVKHFFGKLFIKVYYFLSPYAVSILNKFTWGRSFSASVITFLIKKFL